MGYKPFAFSEHWTMLGSQLLEGVLPGTLVVETVETVGLDVVPSVTVPHVDTHFFTSGS